MTSSTSSSERRYPLLALGAFLVLAAAGLWLRQRPGLRFLVPIVASAERPGPDWYLSYDRGGLDHAVLWHDLAGTAEALRRADVLFLGDSAVMFAFRRESLAPFFERLGLTYYVLGFPYGERDEFPEALIRRYDLHPKWVVVNADPFFSGRESEMAQTVQRHRAFDEWKRRFETVASYEVRHRLHEVVPHLDLFAPVRDWVLFRNRADGTTHVASYAGIPRPATGLREGLLEHAKEPWIERARAFQRELRARGARLVLTTVPPVPRTLALEFGQALDVPVVLPDVPGEELMTLDGNHLDEASARRWAGAFLGGLEGVLRSE